MAAAGDSSTLFKTTILLNDGTAMPTFGLGTYQCSPKEAYNSVRWALEAGYRHIDTAAIYGNEKDVGRAIKDSGIARQDIWVTTKLQYSKGGYESTLNEADRSLRNLGLDYVDLYLIHAPVSKGLRADTWRAMEELQAAGKSRSIGVSNFGIHHLEELFQTCNVKPSVNQIELSPYLLRTEIVGFCQEQGIALEAYASLTQGAKLDEPELLSLATKHSATPAQLLLRWGLQRGFIVLPKSVKRERILENADLEGFSLSPADMAAMGSWDEHFITCWDPSSRP